MEHPDGATGNLSGIKLYSGTCGSLVEISNDLVADENGAFAINTNGLTNGQTYYVEVLQSSTQATDALLCISQFKSLNSANIIVDAKYNACTVDSLTIQVIAGTQEDSVYMSVSLADSVYYIAGSVSDPSVSEDDISDLFNPVFFVDSIAAGDTLLFTIGLLPGCGSDSTLFELSVTGSSGTTINVSDNALNMTHPVFQLTQALITPDSYNAFAGEVFEREVCIVNNGNGFLTDNLVIYSTLDTAFVCIDSSSIGTVTQSNDTSFITINDTLISPEIRCASSNTYV